jgi:hypothetical protein
LGFSCYLDKQVKLNSRVRNNNNIGCNNKISVFFLLFPRSCNLLEIKQKKMNQSLAIQKNESETALLLTRAKDIVMEYGVNGVSVIGTLFNLATIIVLTNRKFEHNFYDFLRCRCVCNFFVCLLGIFLKILPVQQETVEYFPLVFNLLAINTLMRAAFIASVISDNLLILNRLTTLHKKRDSLFYSLSKKVCFFHDKIQTGD